MGVTNYKSLFRATSENQACRTTLKVAFVHPGEIRFTTTLLILMHQFGAVAACPKPIAIATTSAVHSWEKDEGRIF